MLMAATPPTSPWTASCNTLCPRMRDQRASIKGSTNPMRRGVTSIWVTQTQAIPTFTYTVCRG